MIRVQNDLDIIIKKIISCEYDKVSMEKTLRFDSELLSSIFNKCHNNYSKEDSNLVRRETDTIFYILTYIIGICILVEFLAQSLNLYSNFQQISVKTLKPLLLIPFSKKISIELILLANSLFMTIL
ncbi:hypothetical protein [Paraclostridium bifermentans]|uniref:hypothetical protein n=1 Tax=Paraclostridium bifermentans TaxID=1490 RepID=UPI0012E0D692|nr:hypothetical protein [Paraclostridium bifermentans]